MATIVVLNGTSSSGKTSIARAWQERARSIFLNFSIDSVLYALPQHVFDAIVRGEAVPELRYLDLVRGYYACVRELANLGHDLVIDNAVTTEAMAGWLRESIAGHRALLVGLDCSPEVLDARERSRGDRRLGLARQQCARIHQWLTYDVRIDTERTSAEEAAAIIEDALTRTVPV